MHELCLNKAIIEIPLRKIYSLTHHRMGKAETIWVHLPPVLGGICPRIRVFPNLQFYILISRPITTLSSVLRSIRVMDGINKLISFFPFLFGCPPAEYKNNVAPYYRLSVSPKFIDRSPEPRWDGVGRWGVWEGTRGRWGCECGESSMRLVSL